MSEQGWQPVLPFDTDDPRFVLGFECGRLWADLQDDETVRLEQLVHPENAEMMLRMAETAGYDLTWEELGDGWARATFTYREGSGT
jgi:hypothetical protein